MKKQSDNKTTYLIEFANGKRQKITVPSGWKVTFGPAAAGVQKSEYGGRNIPLAIRFYEAENKQRAIFTDVVSFRDLSIEIEEERTAVQEKHGFMEYEGKRKATTFQAKTKEWVNPDAESDTKLLETVKSSLEGDVLGHE